MGRCTTLRRMHRPIVVLACIAWSAWSGDAHAQVRRCVAPSGGVIYTDRRCEDIGAIERAAPAPSAGVRRTAATTCARTVQDLVYEVTSAFDAQDPNRLASVYHWVGVSNSNGYRQMERFSTMVKRPLADVVPVMVGGDTFGTTGTLEGPPPTPRRLVGLRIEQTLGNSITPIRTTFGLQKHVGCWWLRG